MKQGAHYIEGGWCIGEGPAFESTDPATGAVVWKGHAVSSRQIDEALHGARMAFEDWAHQPFEFRADFLRRFADRLAQRKDELALAISREIGKPRWESLTEVESMIGKVKLSIEAYRERRGEVTLDMEGGVGATRYKPHGVVAVFGPFNLPGHLPNGHIVPALLAGNTVVFKPSEQAPQVGELTAEMWELAGAPRGVFNMIQGGREVGEALAKHPQLDGLFFTGGTPAGLALRRALADRPQKILALEMGGNNPLIVAADHLNELPGMHAAAYATVLSAYITAGQRCSCARRLIVPHGPRGDQFLDRLRDMITALHVGPHTDDPEPFIGPVISEPAAERLLATQADLAMHGGVTLMEMTPLPGRPAMLRPGLIDTTNVPDRPDVEIFGPLLQVIRVKDFDDAITEANRTAFGLCAGLLSDSREQFELFYRRVRAGVVHWNRQLTSASGRLPFGGVGLSGNHRPSGFWATDYCSYPVATIEHDKLTLPARVLPGVKV